MSKYYIAEALSKQADKKANSLISIIDQGIPKSFTYILVMIS